MMTMTMTMSMTMTIEMTITMTMVMPTKYLKTAKRTSSWAVTPSSAARSEPGFPT